MAFGDACFETFETMCGVFENPFSAVMMPFQNVLGDLTLVIVWGAILGILWLKTENLALCSIVGILISSTVTGLYEPAQGIGLLLVGVSVGILVFQLIRHKVQTFA